MKKVVLVLGDDWNGLYIDGKLEIENHSLSAYQALQTLSLNSHDFQLDQIVADEEWLEQKGCLPEELSDVKESKE